jgi:DNA repair protein RadD
MILRDYQSRTIQQLYDWFAAGNEGNPCLVLPTGSGKSHIVAALCKDALQNWPETRILMLTHVKELIEQNAEKMRLHWPGAPMGIYSASIGRRDLGEPITFAGIQSVRSKARDLGHVDLVIIDECHLVNHHDAGGYRTLLANLKGINPHLRVVGLTATPYRLGHGLITDKPALFDALLEPVSIEELVHKRFLSNLRSKVTQLKLSTEGVHKRGGEYIEAELQAAVDTKDQNERVVREVISLAGDRKAWLFFCAGVQHANHVAEVLQQHGIAAECVTGETPKKQREQILVRLQGRPPASPDKRQCADHRLRLPGH